MLKSFVSEEDFPKLINILKRCRDGTIKKDVSVINIYGDHYTGKSTLIEVINIIGEGVSVNCESILKTNYVSVVHPYEISAWSGNICYTSRNDILNFEAEKFHNKINSEMTLCSIYSDEYHFIKNPSVFVFETKIGKIIETNTEDKRKPVYLHVNQKKKTYVNCVKIARMCVEEFNNYIEAEKRNNCRKAALTTIICMKKLRIYKDLSVLLGKYVYASRKNDIWISL